MIILRQELAKLLGVTEKYLCASNFNHIQQGAKLKGIEIKSMNGRGKKAEFEIEILNQDLPNEIWKPFPLSPKYQISNLGRVKHPNGGILQGTENKGYVRTRIEGLGQISNHRMVMLTFEPISNPDSYSVDHINGIRNDNRLSNLRWVFQTDNMQFCIENNTEIKEIIANLIQKYGYIETKSKLLTLFNEN